MVRDSLDSACVVQRMHALHDAAELKSSGSHFVCHTAQQILVRVVIPIHTLFGHFRGQAMAMLTSDEETQDPDA